MKGVGGLNALMSEGLPDEATMNRLASEFFAALPGSALPQLGQTAPQPPLPPAEATIAQRAPAFAPSSSTQTGVPDTLASAIGGSAYPSPAPSAGQIPGASQPAPQATQQTPSIVDDRVLAQSFGMPGATDLQLVLTQIHTPVSTAEPTAAPQNNHFYFIDPLHGNSKAAHIAPRETANPTFAQGAHPAFDVNAVRRDFPILQERVNGRPLIWFDNAATTHKPQAVIDRLAYFYAHENSNIHRAAHELAARATDAYESARNKVARFLGASSAEEIIFVRGATEAINLVAKTWGKQHIHAGDEIVVSQLEHHANIVPWQQLASETGAKIRVIPVDDSGQILLDEYRRLLNERTKLVAITQVSNALGTVTPVKEIIDAAHRNGSCVLVDGAQSVSHMRVNVQALDADFFVFSGHKIFGPTGIGVIYGKKKILETMQPWQGGGNMIADVTFEKTIYQPAPMRFEAGTGNIADAVGLGAALDYVERIGIENIARYEHDLLMYAIHGLKTVPGIRLIGTAVEKASVQSFVLDGHTTEEVGKALNQEGVAVRSGHHCAQPILRRFGVEATVRPSLAFYNTCQEVDVMIATLRRLQTNYKANSR